MCSDECQLLHEATCINRFSSPNVRIEAPIANLLVWREEHAQTASHALVDGLLRTALARDEIEDLP